MSEPDLSEFESLAELQELRKANRDLQQKLSKTKAKTADLIEAVYQAAREAAVILGNPPEVPSPPADRRSRRAEVAMLLCSDWHVGKHTSTFNSAVARARVDQLGHRVAKLTSIERSDHPVRECHALLAGDMVDGTNIFPGHAFEVDSTAFAQVFAAAAMLERLLRHLLATFDTVQVWTQTGNHGRLGKRGEYPRTDNLDMLVYKIVENRMADKRLTWHQRTNWYSIVAAGNYRTMLVHGDQIRSFGGNTPAFGIIRKCNAWASGVVEPFVDVSMGHFHQDLVLPLANGRGKAYVNPSIESDSDYAKEFVAATGTPGQRLNFVDPEKGRVTSPRIVWLDDV